MVLTIRIILAYNYSSSNEKHKCVSEVANLLAIAIGSAHLTVDLCAGFYLLGEAGASFSPKGLSFPAPKVSASGSG